MAEKPPPSHHKESRWDRPKPPKDWRWVVGGLGRILIALGVLMFAFVGYQLWGTGIKTAQEQHSLAAQFGKALAAAGVTTVAPSSTVITVPGTAGGGTNAGSNPASTSTTTTTIAARPTLPPGTVAAAKAIPAEGGALARLQIPRMDLDKIVVEGVSRGDLQKGPGHLPETPLPGQLGNAAIAGHRTTNQAPFFDIDKLQPGDPITITTLNGKYLYTVTNTEIVAADAYAQVIPTTDVTKATLTLISCHPRYTAHQRIVVHAELVPAQSDPLTQADPAALPTGDSLPVDETTTAAGSTATASTAPTPSTAATAASTARTAPAVTSTTAAPRQRSTVSADTFASGWFSDGPAIPQALLWAALLVAIVIGSYLVARRFRRWWVGIAVGILPFVVGLYFFFENVNRLLPANL